MIRRGGASAYEGYEVTREHTRVDNTGRLWTRVDDGGRWWTSVEECRQVTIQYHSLIRSRAKYNWGKLANMLSRKMHRKKRLKAFESLKSQSKGS